MGMRSEHEIRAEAEKRMPAIEESKRYIEQLSLPPDVVVNILRIGATIGMIDAFNWVLGEDWTDAAGQHMST